MAIDFEAVLRHSRELQRATSIDELLLATQAAVQAVAGYQHVWLAALEPGTPTMVRLLAIAGPMEPVLWERAPLFPVEGDAMLEAIARATGPVVVEDGRSDARTDKAMVEKLGNRTIVNVPLLLGDERLGALGTGTFGDEGPQPPTAEQLEHLVVFATQLAAAFQRVRLLEQHRIGEREREQLKARMASIQRIESLALLAGGVAHDFNNILGVVLASLGFIENGPLTAQQGADMQAAVEAIERASTIIRQLLATGRQQPLKLESVDMNQRLRGVIALVHRLLSENITVELIEGRHLPTVLADGGQIDRVFMNLCINARDAMPQGGTLTIETEQVVINGGFIATHPWARPGRYLLVSVTDTGTGMPTDVVERIFEPFFTTKTGTGGTGLGLAVTSGIIEQHGGLVHCYSELGVGTTFKVYLPAYERPAAAVGMRLEGPLPRGHERVLVAEDDGSLREAARRILFEAGYEVVTAADGRQAIHEALADDFALVVLDVMMPRASGREAFERIREQKPHTRFVFASGYAADILPPAFLQRNGVELVNKPYGPEQLLRAVRRALDVPFDREEDVG